MLQKQQMTTNLWFLCLQVPLREMGWVKGKEGLRNHIHAILAQQKQMLLQHTKGQLFSQRSKGKKVLEYSLGFPC